MTYHLNSMVKILRQGPVQSNDINLENDKADQSLINTNTDNQIRRAIINSSTSINNISSDAKDLFQLSHISRCQLGQISLRYSLSDQLYFSRL